MRAPIVKYHSKITDVYEVILDKHEDSRGFNAEGYSKTLFESLGFPKLNFETDSYSISFKNSIRGFHGDFLNYKLLSAPIGRIQLFLIDRRHNFPTFNNVLEFEIDESSPRQILVPPGVMNGHACLSERCMFAYKLSARYTYPSEQNHVKWNDPIFSDIIKWKINNPILSERDK